MAKVIRWIARVISVLTLLFFGIFIIGYAVEGDVPGLFTAVALAMILVGLILAWKWEAVGGILIIIGYFFSVFLSPRIWSAWPKPTRERIDIQNKRRPIVLRTGQSMRNPSESDAILLSASAETPSTHGHLQRTENGEASRSIPTSPSKPRLRSG